MKPYYPPDSIPSSSATIREITIIYAGIYGMNSFIKIKRHAPKSKRQEAHRENINFKTFIGNHVHDFHIHHNKTYLIEGPAWHASIAELCEGLHSRWHQANFIINSLVINNCHSHSIVAGGFDVIS